MSERSETRHFLDYWQVLLTCKEIVLATTLIIAVAGLVLTLMLRRTYMASTRIMVNRIVADVPLRESRDSDALYTPYFMKTQLEILQSQHVLDKVINNLRLQEKFARESGRAVAMDPVETRKELRRCIRLRPYLDTNIIEIEVYRKAEKNKISEAARDVMLIANEIADVYARVSMEDARKKSREGAEALREEYERCERQVAEKEKEIEVLKDKWKISGATRSRAGDGSVLEKQRLLALENSRIGAREKMLDRSSRVDKIKALEGENLLYTLAYLTADPALGALRRELTSTKLRLADLEKSFGEEHPDVVKVRAMLSELQKEVDEAVSGAKVALETDCEIAKKNFEQIDRELEEERSKDVERSSETFLPFSRAEEELVHMKGVRDTLKMRWIEEKIEGDLPQTPVKVIDRAEEPALDEYVSPNHYVNLILSLMLGLGCGISLAFFFEYVDTSVKTIEEVERYIGASVLGVIPQKVKPLIDVGESSPHAEAYRVLRTNMQFSKAFGRGKAVCITSGGAGEGKSFTVANLGYVCAQLGDRTLIVDSDMRRPRQHKLFGVSRRPGLSELLREEAGVDAVVVETAMPNLFVMPSGRAAVASAGLLDTQRMNDIVTELKSRFDIVLFDAPPVIGVSDASVLVSKVDGVLLVVQHRSYPKALSLRAKKIVDNVGGNLLGVVLNNINISRDYYYYYHSYTEQYGYNLPDAETMREGAKQDEEVRRAVGKAGKEQG